MNIKPILFNTEMVKAILAGKKTVTRRVIKPQPRQGEEKPHRLPSGCWFFEIPSRRFPCTPDVSVGPYWPPCQPGDILYVRETWAHPSAAEIANGADPEMYLYKAMANIIFMSCGTAPSSPPTWPTMAGMQTPGYG